MTNQDRAEFAKYLFLAGEVFNEPMSEARATAYFTVLADLSLIEVTTAITYAIRESKWFPRPADIRHAVEGSPDARADNAWQRVLTGHMKTKSLLGIDEHDWRMLSLGDKMRLRDSFRRAYMRDEASQEMDMIAATKATELLEAEKHGIAIHEEATT